MPLTPDFTCFLNMIPTEKQNTIFGQNAKTGRGYFISVMNGKPVAKVGRFLVPKMCYFHNFFGQNVSFSVFPELDIVLRGGAWGLDVTPRQPWGFRSPNGQKMVIEELDGSLCSSGIQSIRHYIRRMERDNNCKKNGNWSAWISENCFQHSVFRAFLWAKFCILTLLLFSLDCEMLLESLPEVSLVMDCILQVRLCKVCLIIKCTPLPFLDLARRVFIRCRRAIAKMKLWEVS